MQDDFDELRKLKRGYKWYQIVIDSDTKTLVKFK
jgi:hypothetical protein